MIVIRGRTHSDLNGLDVPADVRCLFCQRAPRKGEIIGAGPAQWDYAGVCPECWDVQMRDPEEDGE